jgi:anthranilate/para-aminobenzoate synthase component I
VQVSEHPVILPLRAPPDDAIVLASERPGAAMLEGWIDGWRILLPWPEETRASGFDEAHLWPALVGELERDTVPAGGALPFAGGWVGFISYEAMATIEAAPAPANPPPEPAAFFARHHAGIVGSPDGEWFLFAPAGEVEGYRALLGDPFVGAARDAARLQTERLPSPESSSSMAHALSDSLGGGEFERRVEAVRELIRDGEVYQVNVTRALSVETACDAGALYRALTGARPPRSSAFLRGDGWTIASASPEVLLDLDRTTGVAETRPIKGTLRRRGEEEAEIAELLASEKDAAEHLMIVDVSRNDLGKIAPPGAVQVAEFRAVRTLEQVHHLESRVRAEGLGRVPLADLLAALSPAASITGAPKRAAVHTIRQLEPVARGVYCGSVGMITAERAIFSVAIRTAVVTENSVRYHAGGGIVWESNGAAEDDECRAKSAAFLRYFGLEDE